MNHDDDNDWCSINEAARRLHVTPTAIRNRIKRGTLETKPNGNHGRLVRVPLPVTLTPDEPVTPTMHGTVPEAVPLTMMETVSVLSRHIERLEAQLDEALK